MSEQTVATSSEERPEGAVALTKRVLNKVFWRYYWSFQISWNYERMQALGFAWSMAPALRHLNPEDTRYAEALQRHLTFFNTSPVVGGPLILGTSVALEESGATTSAETVKVAMMGPLAGIGDNLTFVVYNSIIFTLAAGWAQQGLIIGPIFAALLVLVPYFLAKRIQFTFGYRQGRTLATRLASGALQKFSEGLIVLGMIVLGAFIPSIVKLYTTITYTVPAAQGVKGSKPSVNNVQDQLDKIMPYILPVALTALIYFLLRRFRLNPIVLIGIVLVIGVILGGIGYLVMGHDWFAKAPLTPAS